MADILLFHHAQGLTKGVTAFADGLRSAGHSVTVPDLYDGRTFPTVEEGVTHAKSLGFEALAAAGVAAADGLPNEMVYGGFSLGLMPAQQLAQQRPGARGALLYHGGIPITEFGEAWPEGVALQAHVMRDDPWGDVDDVRELVSQAGGELFLYDGDAHLFTDSSLDAYDPAAAGLVMKRTLAFLDSLS
jgi:dienelactone hydrolase